MRNPEAIQSSDMMERTTLRSSKRFRITAAVIVALIFYALIEYTFSLLYGPERDLYPTYDAKMADFNYLIFEDDPYFIRRLASDLDVIHPLTEKPLRTNSWGFRGPEFSLEKEEGTIRIVILGDTILFGMGLDEKETLARQLARHLEGKRSRIEVIDMSVPSYTSFQGLGLASHYFPDLKPDIVVIGYGFNDATLVNFTEAEILASIPKAQRVLNRLNKVLGWSYLFQWIRNKAKSEETRKAFAPTKFAGTQGKEVKARVPPKDFDFNIRDIIRYTRSAGGEVILVDPNFINFYSRDALQRIGREENIPFLSIRDILENAAPPGEYMKQPGAKLMRIMAFQVRGFEIPEDMLEETGRPFLIELPVGSVRFPPLEARHHFKDDGTNYDIKAGDGIYTAAFKDEGRRQFEFAPCMKILWSQDMRRQMFLTNDFFYRLPSPDTLDKTGLYYSPVMDFRKPSFHEYLADFDNTLMNEKGTRRVAEALLTAVLEKIRKR